MNRIFSIALLGVVAGAVSAAPFEILSFEAGGGIPGLNGGGVVVSNGTFFNVSPVAHHNALPTSSFSASNFFELDSYFTIDGFGPSARNRIANPINNSHTTLAFYGDYGAPGGPSEDYNVGEFDPFGVYIYGPGGHIGDEDGTNPTHFSLARGGVGFAPPPVHSGFAPNATGGRSTRDGIFLGRFTVQAGATLSGSFYISTIDPSSVSGFDSALITIGGPGVMMGTSSGQQLIAISAVPIFGSVRGSSLFISEPTQNEEEAFGFADVYDFWAREVPSPGAAMPLMLAAAVAARRRRPLGSID